MYYRVASYTYMAFTLMCTPKFQNWV